MNPCTRINKIEHLEVPPPPKSTKNNDGGMLFVGAVVFELKNGLRICVPKQNILQIEEGRENQAIVSFKGMNFECKQNIRREFVKDDFETACKKVYSNRTVFKKSIDN